MGTYQARVTGANFVARRLGLAARQMTPEVQRELLELGNAAEGIYRVHAPRLTGRLERGIQGRLRGSTLTVRADARDPETHFDYVGVSRFGRGPMRRTKGFLRFGNGVAYRKSAGRYDPPGDWADKAEPQIDARARASADRLGRRVSRFA